MPHTYGEILFYFCSGKLSSSAAASASSREAASNLKDSLQPAITAALNLVSTAASGQPSAATASSGSTSAPSPATSASTTSPVTAAVKKQRPLLPKEAAQAVQKAVVWNPTKFQTSSQKWHMQKVQRQQQHEEPAAVQSPAQSPGQTQSPQQLQNSSSTRYQTRQAAKGIYTSIIIHLNITPKIMRYKRIKRWLFFILYSLQGKRTYLRVLPRRQLPRSQGTPLLSVQETCRSLQAQPMWLLT